MELNKEKYYIGLEGRGIFTSNLIFKYKGKIMKEKDSSV